MYASVGVDNSPERHRQERQFEFKLKRPPLSFGPLLQMNSIPARSFINICRMDNKK